MRRNLLCKFGVTVVCLVWCCIASPARADDVLFQQNFETDTAGWFDYGGTLTRVPSGTNGITSSSGSYHGELAIGPGYGDGAYTTFGGYSSTWPGGYILQSLDIYVDPANGTIGDGWFLDNAVSDTSGVWIEAGGVGAELTASGWAIAADGDGGGYPGGGITITTAQWLTIVSEWLENGLYVDRNTYIYDSNGVLLYSSLNPNQVLLADIGGWNYGWLAFASGNSLTLPIDNSTLTIYSPPPPPPAPVPEPGSMLAWSMGLLAMAGAVRIRRRRADGTAKS